MIVLAVACAALLVATQTDAVELSPDEMLFGTGAMAALLLGLGLLQIPFGRSMARWLDPPQRPPRDAFQPIDVPVTFVLYILGSLAAVFVGSYLATGEFGEPTEDFLDALTGGQMLLLTAAGQLPVCLYVVAVAFQRPGGLVALGVRRPTPGARLRYTIARYVVGLPMVFGLGVLTSFLYLATGQEPPQQDAAVVISESLADEGLLVFAMAAVVIPLLEEIMFRGFLLEFLVARGGVILGVVLSSALFAALHGASVFLPIFGLAVVLSIVKLRTRSLGAAWLVHGLHNGSSTALIYVLGPSFLQGQ